MINNIVISLTSSLLWRVRGGLRFWGYKLPLNKVWFALFYAGAYCYLTYWNLNDYIICSIATFTSYQEYGWGEYIGCLICGDKPSGRSDCPLVDDIIDTLRITINARDIKIGKFTIHIPQINWKLTDHPVLFGWVGLSLRGLLMTFMIGLAFRSVPYMLSGLAMGTVYWIGGQLNKIKDDGKCGWRWAEWLYGFYLGEVLCVIFRP